MPHEISCAICHQVLQSDKPAGELQKDLTEQMSKHLLRHPDHHRELGLSIQLFATYALMQYVEIPDGEVDLLSTLDTAADTLLGVFGFEPIKESRHESAVSSPML